jgi:hypothetical protein
MTITTVPVAAFHKALIQFFENFHGDDLWCGGMNCKLYTQDEWQDRGEKYGLPATGGTLVTEGEINHALNYGYRGDFDWSFHNEFTEFCKKHGYYWEMGYSWTVHFYENV